MKKIKDLILLGTISIILFSCGSKQNDNYHDLPESSVSLVVNDKAMPEDVDLTKEKTLLNRDYPIEVVLFSDGNWYYDLPNLGTGTGTYSFSNGKIQLLAKRSLFDIKIDIVSKNESGTEFLMIFSDRFGPKSLETEKINF